MGRVPLKRTECVILPTTSTLQFGSFLTTLSQTGPSSFKGTSSHSPYSHPSVPSSNLTLLLFLLFLLGAVTLNSKSLATTGLPCTAGSNGSSGLNFNLTPTSSLFGNSALACNVVVILFSSSCPPSDAIPRSRFWMTAGCSMRRKGVGGMRCCGACEGDMVGGAVVFCLVVLSWGLAGTGR